VENAPEPVVVVDYDPEWPWLFKRLRERVLRALGGLDATVEHIGSTAVPGLAAKPVVDVDVVVQRAEDVTLAVERLAAIGYVHQGDKGVPGREAFRWPEGEPHHHLYVVVAASAAHRRHVLIRDWLLTHPDDAQAYGELKKELAERFRHDRAGYTEAKDAFTDRIMAGAEAEASRIRHEGA
jgi:GrpB-like predicted nucleotidyltransferase (UPF0157 family)